MSGLEFAPLALIVVAAAVGLISTVFFVRRSRRTKD